MGTRIRITASAVFLACFVGCTTYRPVVITLETNPPGAMVFLGDSSKQVDTTPCELPLKSPGDFQLYLKKPGYVTQLKTIYVTEAEDARGRPYLEAVPTRMSVPLDLDSTGVGAGPLREDLQKSSLAEPSGDGGHRETKE